MSGIVWGPFDDVIGLRASASSLRVGFTLTAKNDVMRDWSAAIFLLLFAGAAGLASFGSHVDASVVACFVHVLVVSCMARWAGWYSTAYKTRGAQPFHNSGKNGRSYFNED
jgi:hypothetical protein